MSKKHKNKQHNKPVEQPIKVANVVKEKKKWSMSLPRFSLSSPKVYLTNGLGYIVGGFSMRLRAMVTGLTIPFVRLQSLVQDIRIQLWLRLDSLSTMKYNETVRQHVASALIVIVGSIIVMKAAGM